VVLAACGDAPSQHALLHEAPPEQLANDIRTYDGVYATDEGLISRAGLIFDSENSMKTYKEAVANGDDYAKSQMADHIGISVEGDHLLVLSMVGFMPVMAKVRFLNGRRENQIWLVDPATIRVLKRRAELN